MHIHHPDIHIMHWAYMAYVPSLIGIDYSGVYFAITCEVEVAVGCVWHIYVKRLALHFHIACLLYEPYL